MAKSARASSRKTNNQKLKKSVFGPVETARIERLSAKLLEIAAQPKPEPDGLTKDQEAMEVDDAQGKPTSNEAKAEENDMDIDKPAPSSAKSRSKRIEKRKTQKSRIAFPTVVKRKGKRSGKK